jgi:hypothetical protein
MSFKNWWSPSSDVIVDTIDTAASPPSFIDLQAFFTNACY